MFIPSWLSGAEADGDVLILMRGDWCFGWHSRIEEMDGATKDYLG